MKLFAIIMFHTENRQGRINEYTWLLNLKNLEHIKYQGTSPPLNKVVKKKKKEILFLQGKSGLASTYPVIADNPTAVIVPTAVTNMVMP